jgi:hypothetical protein
MGLIKIFAIIGPVPIICLVHQADQRGMAYGNNKTLMIGSCAFTYFESLISWGNALDGGTSALFGILF